jgi:D-amino-acid dehydrogenase
MNEPRSEVLVVGAGVVGCFAAKHLVEQGCQVTLVERATVGSGASFGNCGFVCPSHVHPLCAPGAIANALKTLARFGGALSISPRFDPPLWDWLWRFARHCNAAHFHHASAARHALLQSSREQYRQLASEHADALRWQTRGLLNVYRSVRDFEAFHHHAEQLRSEFGVEVRDHPGDSVCELVPELRGDLAGGWHFPQDAHLSPADCLSRLRGELEAAGVRIQEHSTVVELHADGHGLQSVEVTREGSPRRQRLTADTFVFATGAEAGRWGKALGCKLPIIPGKGYSVTIHDGSLMPAIPMIFEDDHVAVTPLGDRLRLGSTMQLTGFDRSIPEKRITVLKRAAARHLRTPLPEGREERWAGWRPMTPDGLPCIGASPKLGNVFLAAGNGMIGMASGPASGQLAAELAIGSVPHLDPAPYRPDRFASAAGSLRRAAAPGSLPQTASSP